MSRHEDLLLQLIQRDPDKIRSILGLPAPKPDLSWYEGAEVWIEAGHRSDRGAELRIAFGGATPAWLCRFLDTVQRTGWQCTGLVTVPLPDYSAAEIVVCSH